MRYTFSYRRKLFWSKFEVIGHKYEENQNKMIIFFPDGGLQEIKDWKNCECKLGADWFAETKKEMEQSVGQKIPTIVDKS